MSGSSGTPTHVGDPLLDLGYGGQSHRPRGPSFELVQARDADRIGVLRGKSQHLITGAAD
ncbi:hypothetical protein MSHO_41650 [Mycobacterium shottsii]|uniref:Uncharacterized protein n=1 Tax=Mycobacterium shottsii TaxID=133549 RepID=A0A7I7LGS1_9MYCO|nr:hypothetical protein MSHO_41650 [Mycobacterium shottsii]